jgi:hypothetical protein
MVDQKKLELIKKLRALAERGVGGEKEGAQKKLDQLMKKYDIQEMDLSDELEENHDFRYRNEYEKILLRQLFYKIVPDYKQKAYVYKYGRGSRTTMGVSCTKAQALQIQIEYDFYRDLWKEEVDFFMDAFIQKHRIFAEPTEGGGTDESKMSKEDLFRMMAMMGVMQDKSVKPLLESK